MQRECLKPRNSAEQPEDVDIRGSFDSLTTFHPGYKDKIRQFVYLTKLLGRSGIALNNTVISSFNGQEMKQPYSHLEYCV